MRYERLFCLVAVIAAGFWGRRLAADVVVLDNGSRLVGTIQVVEGGKLILKTDFAGDLSLDLSRVRSMSTDASVNLALPDGQKVFGKIAATATGSRIETTDGASVPVKPQALAAVWGKDARDPTLPKPRAWSYEVFLDLAGKTGNSEKIRLGGGGKAILEGPADRLKLYVTGARAQDDGQKTEDEIIGGADYERRISGKHSWYAHSALERDTVEGVDFRSVTGLGYGYYFIDEDHWKLRGRGGLQYRYEDYDNGDSSSDVALDLGLNHRMRISDWADVVTDITYAPALDDFSNYRLYHETALDIPLGHSDVWKLRLGISNEYNTAVASDKDRLDTTYFIRLVMNWGQ